MERKPIKDFHCLEMKDRAQAKVRAKLARMTEAEQLEYWRKGTEKLKKEIEVAKAKRLSESAK